MKNDDVKYTEALLLEEELDIDAILKSRWRYPIRVWFKYKVFLIKVFVVDLIVAVMFSIKKYFIKWKK